MCSLKPPRHISTPPKPGLPPWGPHVRFRRVQTLVREGSPLVKLRNSALGRRPAAQGSNPRRFRDTLPAGGRAPAVAEGTVPVWPHLAQRTGHEWANGSSMPMTV